ncbi:hypothetical protein STEG23_026517 [Scotinomys teguina]
MLHSPPPRVRDRGALCPQPAQRVTAYRPLLAFERRRSLHGSCIPLTLILPSRAAFSSTPENCIVPSPAVPPPTPTA